MDNELTIERIIFVNTETEMPSHVIYHFAPEQADAARALVARKQTDLEIMQQRKVLTDPASRRAKAILKEIENIEFYNPDDEYWYPVTSATRYLNLTLQALNDGSVIVLSRVCRMSTNCSHIPPKYSATWYEPANARRICNDEYRALREPTRSAYTKNLAIPGSQPD